MTNALARKIDVRYNLKLPTIIDLLRKNNIVDDVLAQKIAKENKIYKEHPLEIIANYKIPDRRNPNKIIGITALTQWYASKEGYPFIRLDPMELKLESLVNIISHAYATRLQILPFKIEQDKIHFATCDVTDIQWVKDIERTQKKKVIIHIATPGQITTLLNDIYVIQATMKRPGGNSRQDYNRLLREGKTDEIDNIIDGTRHRKFTGNQDSIVQIANWLIGFAENERASDIHIEPRKGMGHIRFRIDGKLRLVYKLHPEDVQTVITRFKILAKMKIDEKRKPQDGQVRYYYYYY